jgi:hypothetical protein
MSSTPGPAHEREALAARVVVAGDLLAEDVGLDSPQVRAGRQQPEQLQQLLVLAPLRDRVAAVVLGEPLAPGLRRRDHRRRDPMPEAQVAQRFDASLDQRDPRRRHGRLAGARRARAGRRPSAAAEQQRAQRQRRRQGEDRELRDAVAQAARHVDRAGDRRAGAGVRDWILTSQRTTSEEGTAWRNQRRS